MVTYFVDYSHWMGPYLGTYHFLPGGGGCQFPGPPFDPGKKNLDLTKFLTETHLYRINNDSTPGKTNLLPS